MSEQRNETALLLSERESGKTYLVKRTITEEFLFDPDVIREHFGEMYDAWEGSDEDFIFGLFEEHDGSTFGDRFFCNTNLNVGLEVVVRGDDE